MAFKRKVICRIPKVDPELAHRLEVLEAKVAHYHPDGVTVSVNKQTVYVERETTINVHVVPTMRAESIKLYRGETLIQEATNSDGFTYQDSPTVQTAGTISYHVETTISGVNYEASVNISAVADSVTGITWTGGNISPASVEVGHTATLIKGTVTAVYASGATEVVTESAVFSAQSGRGTIDGTTYTAPSTDGNDTISVTYAGKTASNTLPVTVTAAYLTVQIGHGATYSTATFTDTNRQLTQGMHLTQAVNAGDYLFIKVDKQQSIVSATTDNENPMWNTPIAFDNAEVDGNYKYYKTADSYSIGLTARILIVTISNN